MNYLKLIAFTIFFGNLAYSQNVDERLLERYSQKELQEIKEHKSNEYNLLVYALENGLYTADAPTEKSIELGSIEITSKEYDFISLGLELKDVNQYFLVKGTNKMLVLKSTYVLENELKNKK